MINRATLMQVMVWACYPGLMGLKVLTRGGASHQPIMAEAVLVPSS